MRVLEVSDVVKQYRNGTLANDHISLALEPGEVYGLLGPNGAGKTTLVRQVLGLLKPSSGGITVNGVDVVSNPGYARANIGFLPQSEVSMAGIRVGELIEGVARLRRLGRKEARQRSDALIDRLQLGPFQKTQMVRASGGIRRLTGFAAAIVGGARLLVLDEPTNDIDPVRRQLLWTTIADLGREGIAVLLVTHNLAEAERVIDRFAIIDHGRILQEGTPSALRSLVSERLRLEVTMEDGVRPHPALRADGGPGKYFFDHEDLTRVSTWLESIRSQGKLIDFRIAPPSLDDIYTATVTNRVPEAAK
jgi:ABC-type multidrug transport system ATPase subunit